ncbi:MAG: GNAT family N-acetyltransferase [Actinomycetota bacterium]
MTIEIRTLTDRHGDPAAFATLVATMQADWADRDPGDPLPSANEVADTVFRERPDGHVVVTVARRNAEPAGFAFAVTQSAPDDPDQVSDCELFVMPDQRGHGVGAALTAAMAERLQALGQTSLVAYTLEGVEPDRAAAICARYGMTARQHERCSRVDVARIDGDQIAAWVAAAANAAPGYRIHTWQGAVPTPLVDAWAAAQSAMTDVPIDQLDYTVPPVTPEQVRRKDAALAATAWLSYGSLVVGPDGDAAGMSMMMVHPDRPQLAHQEDTAVVAAHRGRGIGRWLKAATFQYVNEHHRDLTVIETYNAEDNPWMLAINEAMGFRPHHGYTAHQGPLAVIAERAGGSRSAAGESRPE